MPPKRKAPSSSARGRGGRGRGTRGRSSGSHGRGQRNGGVTFNLGGDEHIDDIEGSGSEDDVPQGKGAASKALLDDDDDEVQETAAEKRLRLAKQYLAQMEAAEDSDEEGSSDEERGVGDTLGARLEKERMKAAGHLRRALADGLKGMKLEEDSVTIIKGHKLSPTCVALTSDEHTAFSGGKDDAIIRYDLETNTRVAYLAPYWRSGADHQAHEKEVLALAVSSDSRYLAAGGRDQQIRVYDLRTNGLVKTFTGHRDAVSALAFRVDTHALYSGSFDRCLKHWNLDSMAYVETQYGHQSEINGIDAWRKERPVTCGRDRTVRVWKLIDESHMLLRAPQGGERGVVMGGSMDCLAMQSEESYITGGEDGVLAMWNINKKKPTVVIPAAHGGGNHWITSVAAVKGSDLVASGSNDGYIRLWKAEATQGGHGSTMTALASLPTPGYVNGLALGSSGSLLVAACGKEHKLGRWSPDKSAKNGIYVMKLHRNEMMEEEEEEEEGSDDDDDDDDDEEEEEEEE